MFESGPRLIDNPQGDPRRQAVASLRGYAYQLYTSALAWLALKEGEELFLEVAEDYAIASREALQAVQVRDTARSGPLTIRSSGVASTINSFVDLAQRNPTRLIEMRFLTTSEVAVERAAKDRVAGNSSLLYWRRAAAGADIIPLRAILMRLDLSPDANNFVATRNDEQLRSDLLQRIHWDGGAADLVSVRQELERTLLHVSERSLDFTIEEVRYIGPMILERVLETIIGTEERCLNRFALREILERATYVSVARRDLEALVRGHSHIENTRIRRPQPLRREDDTPMPTLVAPRTEAIVRLQRRLASTGLVFVCGATGMGKTLLARLTAKSTSGVWMIADFVQLDPRQTGEKLDSLVGALASTDFHGLILDDLNELDAPHIATQVALVRNALARRDRLCVVTSYRPPSVRAQNTLGISQDAIESVPDLTEEEVWALVHDAGGDAQLWSRAIYVAAAYGHPQLAQATIADLQRRSWPSAELGRLSQLDTSGVDIDAERAAARRRLVATAPEASRILLYRASVLIGSFKREVALALSAAEPRVASAGEHLDSLIGPWIDLVGNNRLRVSPLLSDAGSANLTRNERIILHKIAARQSLVGETLDIQDANSGFMHALLGEETEALQRLSGAVLLSSPRVLSRLSSWLPALRMMKPDQPIYPSDAVVSRFLRLGQVLLEVESEQAPNLVESWRALCAELLEEPDLEARESFEVMALSKVLLHSRFAEVPDWFAHLIRLSNLLESSNLTFESLRGRVSLADGEEIDLIGFCFINMSVGVPSIASLLELFQRLDSVDSSVRNRMFARLHRNPGDIAFVINAAWLKEHEVSTIDGRAAARAYSEMAYLAISWEERDVAVRCFVTQAVMLDEYADSDGEALAVLDEAEARAGADSVISRARAKIAYRRNRHGEALDILRRIATNAGLQDPVERAFLCREAAISATEIGQVEEGLAWFQAAREAAAQGRGNNLGPMIVGLAGDIALAESRCHRFERALVCLADALDESADIDPASSLKGMYLNKALGHACLWLNERITQEGYTIEGVEPVAPPGFCSNPEPSRDIRTLPLSSLTGGYYLLAIGEIRLGRNLGIETRLNARLNGGHIFLLETQRRQARLERGILLFDLDSIASHLPDALEAIILGAKDMAAGGSRSDGLRTVDGPFPSASSTERSDQDARALVNDVFFALRVLTDLQGTSNDEIILESLQEQVSQLGFPRPTFLDEESEVRQAIFWRIWLRLRAEDVIAEDFFLIGLRMVEWARGSIFGRLLLPALGRWATREWLRILAEQRFLLRNPAVTVPDIQAAIAAPHPDGAKLATILLAARPAFALQLDPALIAFLSPASADSSAR